MAGEIAHPLIVPLPRLVAPAALALRHLALARLRAMFASADARLDLELPNGETVELGSRGLYARARVHDDRLFLRVLLRGELGSGESFVAGEWSSDDVVGVVRAFLRATNARGVESPLTRLLQLPALLRHRRAANTHVGSQRNVHAHYDLGNAFYRLFLDDDTLAYSCAIFPAASLADAQRAKFDRLCDWLALSPRDHLLEIGCGWGGMAIHAARTRGCRVTAITVSREQYELASARVAAAGLADRVTIEYRDYRGVDPQRTFDKIVSIEMLEQVGFEYLPGFFATCARVLAPGGTLAVQTITMPDDRFDAYRRSVDWMQTYIFPGTLIPSLGAIRAACPPFAITRSDDIGDSYVPTLRAWRDRFVAALPAVRALGFDPPFIRTWLLYLAFSEAAFAERTLGDHQLLLTR
ncbi:MAG TPA: cyclopropane-fatty-acyl-phospholipid synthase family protein [Kofleriaceae bacterium]|nr:cyclopropane-fatty-acyl-phospholipid synthase family protein [Kofleriaceae bacterium]